MMRGPKDAAEVIVGRAAKREDRLLEWLLRENCAATGCTTDLAVSLFAAKDIDGSMDTAKGGSCSRHGETWGR